MVRKTKPKQGATIKKRSGLRELRQAPSRPLREKQSFTDRPKQTKHKKLEDSSSKHNEPRTRRSFQNVQEHRLFENEYSRMLQAPLEFEAINTSHTNGTTKRRRQHHNADSFEIHIPVEPSSGPMVSKNKDLPPRPRTSRGRPQDGTQQAPPPTPAFTTLFPPAEHIAQQLLERRLSDEQQVSRFSMTSSDGSTSDALAMGPSTSDSASENRSGQSTPRKSKFLEGSMNDRSQGIASSWDPDRCGDSRLSDIGDISDMDESTPRPKARVLQKSKLSESSQVHEPTKLRLEGQDEDTEINTTKGTRMHHFGQDPPPVSTLKHQRSKGLGLRSSISTFNFHGLSDKFKLFGSSKSSKKATPTSTTEEQAHKALMNERKRKAEIAYAEQFGSIKKRKQLPSVQVHQQKPAPTNPVPDKDNAKDTSTSTSAVPATTSAVDIAASKPAAKHFSRPLTTTQPSQPNSTSIGSNAHPATRLNFSPRPRSSSHGSSNSTVRKRPSRKDLEKENAHLRALLAAATSLQNLHQQQQQQPVPPMPSLAFGKTDVTEKDETVPPMPKIPDVLSGTGKEKGKGKENVVGGGGGSTKADGGKKVGAGTVQWEWPEDCF